MTHKEKSAAQNIAQIMRELPEDKRAVLLAYGEGMAAVSKMNSEREDDKE